MREREGTPLSDLPRLHTSSKVQYMITHRNRTHTRIDTDALVPPRGIDTHVILVTNEFFTTTSIILSLHQHQIATVAPSSTDVEHTLNTLKYADRLKQIRARVVAGEGERGGGEDKDGRAGRGRGRRRL